METLLGMRDARVARAYRSLRNAWPSLPGSGSHYTARLLRDLGRPAAPAVSAPTRTAAGSSGGAGGGGPPIPGPQPQLPAAQTPTAGAASGGTVTETTQPATATSGGSNMSGNGGRGSPPSAGACEPENSGQGNNNANQPTADELRAEARDKWQAATGRRAAWDGLEVHHLVPLEWRGVYSGDINGLDNLAGMSRQDHAGITEAWRIWKGGLGGRMPAEEEVLQQRDYLNQIYDPLMTPPC